MMAGTMAVGIDSGSTGPTALDHASLQNSARLAAFVAMLLAWNRRINLIARGDAAQVWKRHVADSAQLWLLRPAAARHWVDLGSGGGFPGLVIACLAADAASGAPLRFTLVEADGRKAAFLREAVRVLGLEGVEIRADRFETVAPLGADVVSARAVAALPDLWPQARRHLNDGGIGLFPKGANHVEEAAATLAQFSLSVIAHRSATDPSSAILAVTERQDA
jgi:16S rRNA (guanine527-N7)-methyltransferase